MKRIILAAALTLAAALPARAEEGIVTYKSLAPDVAFDLARTALNKCRKDGYQVAVVVVDRFGLPLVAGARPIRRNIWRETSRPARPGRRLTSPATPASSSKTVQDGTLSPASQQLPKVTPLVGGLIIQAGGSLLGGVGVGGRARRRQGRGLRQGRAGVGARQARILANASRSAPLQ